LKFKVDGAGKEALPITYEGSEGTTYLPVQAVSKLFQTPIKYDGKTYSGAYSMSEWDASLSNDYMSF